MLSPSPHRHTLSQSMGVKGEGGREGGGEKEGKEEGEKLHYEKTLDTSLSYLPSAVES